jgi:adenine-specific DNA methylase
VDLVLTDPPYFDDVQYAELASIFLAWARASKLLPDSAELDLRAEAVANSTRRIGAKEYRNLLRAILIETRRTLKPDGGRIILTYHNTDLRAWWALGSALHDAGLSICALAVTQAENERDHAKRDRLGFSRDLVLECRPMAARGEPEVVWYEQDEPEAQELVAAGRTLASMPDCETQKDFRERFRNLRGDLRPVRIGRRASDREQEETDV